MNKQILIAPDGTMPRTKMEIAKTIAHEAIHAYLNVKLCDGGQGIPIPTLNDLDFFNVVNQQYNSFIGLQDQHNFIYNYLLPTLSNILVQVKDSLVTPADNTTVLSLPLYPLFPDTNQVVSFNWIDCLNNLALSGLQSCAFFQNEIGIFNTNGSPPTIINTIKWNNYNQYNTLCQIYLK